MSWAVDAILGVRDGARERAAKIPDSDPLRGKLTKLADDADAIRGKIVATKEGGAITGEERLREFVAGLYGDVGNYEGRPTVAQSARAGALARELEDVIGEFTALTDGLLPSLNRELQALQLFPVTVVAENDWK
jgi:hypothetical protein